MTAAREHALTGATLRTLPAAVDTLLGPDVGPHAACKGRAPVFDDDLVNETEGQREPATTPPSASAGVAAP
jgi:hypothetical protein